MLPPRSGGDRPEPRGRHSLVDVFPYDLDTVSNLEGLRVAVDDIDEHPRPRSLGAIQLDHAGRVWADRGQIRVERMVDDGEGVHRARACEFHPLDLPVLTME